MLVRVAHGPSHVGKAVIAGIINSQWHAPGFAQVAEELVKRCMVRRQNKRGGGSGRHDHLPMPEGPFTSIQVFFTHMPPCQGFKYMLVVTDTFSKWPECYPVRKEDTMTVVKCLMKELIPRFGVPQSINSDRGPAFVSKVAEKLKQIHHLHTAFGLSYNK